MNSIFKKYQEKGVSFIGVNTDGPRNQSKIKPMINSLKVEYPIVLDTDNTLMNDLNVNVLPTLIIFDKKGKSVFIHEGFILGDEKLIEEKILSLLAAK